MVNSIGEDGTTTNSTSPSPLTEGGGHLIYLTPILFTPFLFMGGFATSLLLYVILKFYRRSIHPYFFLIFFCFCQVCYFLMLLLLPLILIMLKHLAHFYHTNSNVVMCQWLINIKILLNRKTFYHLYFRYSFYHNSYCPSSVPQQKNWTVPST